MFLLLLLLLQLPSEGPILDSISERIEARLEATEKNEVFRYDGLREMLQKQEHGIGPIREGLQDLRKLIQSIIALLVCYVVVSLYIKLFRT